jgi:hypothetical protein
MLMWNVYVFTDMYLGRSESKNIWSEFHKSKIFTLCRYRIVATPCTCGHGHICHYSGCMRETFVSNKSGWTKNIDRASLLPIAPSIFVVCTCVRAWARGRVCVCVWALDKEGPELPRVVGCLGYFAGSRCSWLLCYSKVNTNSFSSLTHKTLYTMNKYSSRDMFRL